MPKPYSIDLREKIVTAYENQEGSMQKLAKRFKVSKNFVALQLNWLRGEGHLTSSSVSVVIIDEKKFSSLKQFIHPSKADEKPSFWLATFSALA